MQVKKTCIETTWPHIRTTHWTNLQCVQTNNRMTPIATRKVNDINFTSDSNLQHTDENWFKQLHCWSSTLWIENPQAMYQKRLFQIKWHSRTHCANEYVYTSVQYGRSLDINCFQNEYFVIKYVKVFGKIRGNVLIVK